MLLVLFSEFVSSTSFKTDSAFKDSNNSSDWFFCLDKSSNSFCIFSNLTNASLLFLFLVISSNSLIYWFVKSDSFCFKLASTSNLFAILVAVFATSVATFAWAFKLFAFSTSLFFLSVSLIEFAIANSSFAFLSSSTASAVFWVANPNASCASCFNFWASSLASLASVFAIDSNWSLVTFLLVLVFDVLLSSVITGLVVLTEFIFSFATSLWFFNALL